VVVEEPVRDVGVLPAKVLPSTGAPNYLEQLVLFAGLMLALGVTMTTLATMRGRRRLEQ